MFTKCLGRAKKYLRISVPNNAVISNLAILAALSEFYSPIPSCKNAALHFLAPAADVFYWTVWGLE